MSKLKDVDTSKRKQDRNLTKTEDVEKTLQKYMQESKRNAEALEKSVQTMNTIWQKGVNAVGGLNKAVLDMTEEMRKKFEENLETISKTLGDIGENTASKISANMTILDNMRKESAKWIEKYNYDFQYNNEKNFEIVKKNLELQNKLSQLDNEFSKNQDLKKQKFNVDNKEAIEGNKSLHNDLDDIKSTHDLNQPKIRRKLVDTHGTV